VNDEPDSASDGTEDPVDGIGWPGWPVIDPGIGSCASRLRARSAACGPSGAAEIASEGQLSRQVKQPVQWPVTRATSSSIVIASNGHSSTHIPQPMHFSESISTNDGVLIYFFLPPTVDVPNARKNSAL
jgi:hypothetical protein